MARRLVSRRGPCYASETAPRQEGGQLGPRSQAEPACEATKPSLNGPQGKVKLLGDGFGREAPGSQAEQGLIVRIHPGDDALHAEGVPCLVGQERDQHHLYSPVAPRFGDVLGMEQEPGARGIPPAGGSRLLSGEDSLIGDHLTSSIRPDPPVDYGPVDEFQALYQRYFRRLVHDIRRRVSSRAAAEDLAQETLVRAFVKLDRFDRERELWPWIRGISRRILADYGPRLSREIPGEPPDAAHVQPEFSAIEERDVLSAALARLHPRHRVAMGLRYVQDWEPERAAAFLGISVAGFHQLLFRARERLRQEYRRLTDGVPGLVALTWLRRTARGLTERARRRIAKLSTFPSSEPLSRTVASAALVGLFALVPPVIVSNPPAQADDGFGAGLGFPPQQLLRENLPAPPRAAEHDQARPLQEGPLSATARPPDERSPGPVTGPPDSPDQAMPPEEDAPQQETAPPGTPPGPTPTDQPGGAEASPPDPGVPGNAVQVAPPDASNSVAAKPPPNNVVSVHPGNPLPIPAPAVPGEPIPPPDPPPLPTEPVEELAGSVPPVPPLE